MYWFTSDEHYGHKNVIKYNDRPFATIEEMDDGLIRNHNSLVGKDDITIHAGDFTLWKNVEGIYKKYINCLNGNHIFLKGSHDYWLKTHKSQQIWEKLIDKKYIVVCHYSMRTWARSHYNSFQLYGHSHGQLEPVGKQWDIGVDNNDYFPISWLQVVKIMEKRPDNPNYHHKKKE